MQHTFTAASLLFLFASACSSSVVVVPAGDGGVDAPPDAPPPDDAPDVPPPPDRPSVCTRTSDRASIEVTAPDGAAVSCASLLPGMPQSPPVSVRGVARVVDDATFEVDTCLPDAGCRPSVYRVRVTAPGLSARVIADGAFVELRYSFTRLFGCASSLSVAGVASAMPSGIIPRPQPDAGAGEDRIADAGSGTRPDDAGFAVDIGAPRPDGGSGVPVVPAGARLYLAVSDGTTSVLYDGLSMDRARTGCGVEGGGPSCGPVVPDLYMLRLRHPQRAVGLEVPMGATAAWNIPIVGGTQNLRMRNLRSFETGACDDYWNWAWWITDAR